MTTLTFPMAPAEYLARQSMLAASGVVLAGTTGTVDYEGVEVGYTYNGVDTLTIVVRHKPWIIPESTVDNKIKQWFAQPIPVPTAGSSITAHRYDRIAPPPLPAHMMLTAPCAAPPLPLVVDLRAHAGPIKNQGPEGSCTGHAFSSAMEWICRRWLNKSPVLSPQFFYAQELVIDGDFPQDYGSSGLTGCRVATSRGCCEDALYPYTAGRILRPTAEQEVNALEYLMGAYHGVPGSGVALSVLGDPAPWPLEIGFTVYESFESDEVVKTGVMPLPKLGERCLGGHEVAGTGGYDVGPTPTLRPKGCPPAVLIQNSWGTGWGLNGWFWMPLEILDHPDTDIKIIHSGKPW